VRSIYRLARTDSSRGQKPAGLPVEFTAPVPIHESQVTLAGDIARASPNVPSARDSPPVRQGSTAYAPKTLLEQCDCGRDRFGDKYKQVERRLLMQGYCARYAAPLTLPLHDEDIIHPLKEVDLQRRWPWAQPRAGGRGIEVRYLSQINSDFYSTD